VTEAEWAAYHSIREQVLWVARGRIGVYDRAHPDESAGGHHPLLLIANGEPVGVARVDIADGVAVLRRVAIRSDVQRQGHGRALLALAETFARDRGCTLATANVARDAVEFYVKTGFQPSGSALASGSVHMTKRSVSRGLRHSGSEFSDFPLAPAKPEAC
jgi:GNAT superfamily N-acetyltransferase